MIRGDLGRDKSQIRGKNSVEIRVRKKNERRFWARVWVVCRDRVRITVRDKVPCKLRVKGVIREYLVLGETNEFLTIDSEAIPVIPVIHRKH